MNKKESSTKCMKTTSKSKTTSKTTSKKITFQENGEKKYVEASFHEILPGLWIGDAEAAENLRFLKNKNITCIINCTDNIPFVEDSQIVHKIRLSVKDNLERTEITKLYKLLNTTVNQIYSLLPNHRILIHCKAGRQRSATIIVAYLMKFGNLSKKEAIEILQSKRLTCFRPGVNFEPALDRFQTDCNLFLSENNRLY